MLCHNDLSLNMGCFLQDSHGKLIPTMGYQESRDLVLLRNIKGEPLENNWGWDKAVREGAPW